MAMFDSVICLVMGGGMIANLLAFIDHKAAGGFSVGGVTMPALLYVGLWILPLGFLIVGIVGLTKKS